MKVRVCKDRCFGCTACTTISSEMFKMDDDGLAVVIPEVDEEGFANVIDGCEDNVEAAANSCPGSAIETQ